MGELVFNYSAPDGGDNRQHIWSVVGEKGGVHVWAAPQHPDLAKKWGEKFYGGVEVHSRTRLYDFGDGAPNHKDCWLLKGPCWHDGSSLYFSENIEPIIRHYDGEFPPHITEYINGILADWYSSKFSMRCD